MGPITATRLTEVAWLGEIIVVVVTKLSIGGITARAREVLLLRRWSSGGVGFG